MVVTTSMGIGLFITIATIFYYLAADPIPDKSDNLYRILLDSGDPRTVNESDLSIPPQLTYTDANNLLSQKDPYRLAVMHGATAVIEPTEPNQVPFEVIVRVTSNEFFSLFDVPFEYGTSWTHEEEEELTPLVVLSKRTNDRLFGGTNSIGQSVQISATEYQVVGVLEDWAMRPKAYDLMAGAFDQTAGIFLPFRKVIESPLPRRGSTNCWKVLPSNEYQDFLNSECTWIQAWVELKNADERFDFANFLSGYIEEQKKLGRFERPNRSRLFTLTEWLDFRQVVAGVLYVLLASSLMFLLVCQFNTLSLLMAKLLSQAREIGIRRALGASQVAIFTQTGAEALVIGILGSIFGLLIAFLGVEAVTFLLRDEEGTDEFFRIDLVLVGYGVFTAVVSTILVALYPMYRASRLPVASQLRINQ